MAGNTLFAFLSLILTAGGCVMMFFVLLGGTREDWVPLNKVYFLWADTSNIPGAPDISQWTLWNVCESSDGNVYGDAVNCGPVHAAYPFLPQQNFGTTRNVPANFLNNHRTYYYLSRFAFAFYLISIFFMIASMLTGILALCSRLGSALSAVAAGWALFCVTTTASLMTAVFVLGRGTFHDAGLNAGVGYYAFGFTWGALGCMLAATVLYCLGFTAARRHRHRERALDAEKRGGSRLPFFRRHSPAGESEHPIA
ncbi:hypothetical protein H072_9587 [Dactylellina haptotyla CBS 200.50]|uniref:SUR7 protein n=1 Tax=Dactylellina haptotyla (strain CBS 200.50) TaxID=1284197 RepID=S8A2C0_DACHA|nr:hypothetical protein H072_9587 [Dactylellina haptotyla CBS 200.50]